jgi:hypothetical protein
MRAFVAALVWLLGGCAQLAPGAGETARVNEIVAQTVAAVRAPATEQRRALRLAQEAYRRDRGMANRLHLATLLATLPTPLRDDAAAYALLKPLAAAQGESPLANFGALLAAQIAERRQLARESERALKESESAAKESERTAKEYERSARAAEERAQTLLEQLNALKAIERGIVEREEKMRRNRR